jgi:hypothetical protein
MTSTAKKWPVFYSCTQRNLAHLVGQVFVRENECGEKEGT